MAKILITDKVLSDFFNFAYNKLKF